MKETLRNFSKPIEEWEQELKDINVQYEEIKSKRAILNDYIEAVKSLDQIIDTLKTIRKAAIKYHGICILAGTQCQYSFDDNSLFDKPAFDSIIKALDNIIESYVVQFRLMCNKNNK